VRGRIVGSEFVLPACHPVIQQVITRIERQAVQVAPRETGFGLIGDAVIYGRPLSCKEKVKPS
jgi:hypothetical protein